MVNPRRRNMEKAETNHFCRWPSLRQPQYPGARPQTQWRSTAPARTPEAPLSRTRRWCSLWHWQVLWDRLRPVLWSPWWWRSWPFHAASVTERSHLTEEKCSGNGIKRDIQLGLKTVEVKDEDTGEHICSAFFQPVNRLLEFKKIYILHYIMTIYIYIHPHAHTHTYIHTNWNQLNWYTCVFVEGKEIGSSIRDSVICHFTICTSIWVVGRYPDNGGPGCALCAQADSVVHRVECRSVVINVHQWHLHIGGGCKASLQENILSYYWW